MDVGIQQSGVEHAATEEMTARTHDLVAMMLPEGDEKTFDAAYAKTDQGTYKLNAQGEKEQAELDRMVSLPLVAIHYSHQVPDLDLDQAFPPAARGPRGRAGGEKTPHLPDGWLDHPYLTDAERSRLHLAEIGY